MQPAVKRETILVLEDDHDIRELIEYNLARKGYRVRCAANGEEGLRKARTEAPDLVILDLMLSRSQSRARAQEENV